MQHNANIRPPPAAAHLASAASLTRPAAQQQLETAERHGGERRQLRVFQPEAEVLRVTIGGALHIRALVP